MVASAVTLALVIGGSTPALAQDTSASPAPVSATDAAQTATPEPSADPGSTGAATEGPMPSVPEEGVMPSAPDVGSTTTTAPSTAAPAPTESAARSGANGAIPALDITLPAAYTLENLNASKNKIPADPSSEAHAVVNLVDPVTPANNVVNASLEEIKGRGNFTWLLEKKPYQLKFDTSTSLLGMPKAKTWILLANHADPSLLRNKVALDLAAQIGIAGSPDARFVDLTINGEFLGNYLLTEKVEVKKNRLDLAHPGGILLELDNSYGKSEEFTFTTTTSGTTFVLKDAVQKVSTPLSPELASSYDSARRHIAAFESALYAPAADWATISSMIDVDSFLAYYFVLEFSENPDAVTSSVYFWRDGPDDVLHAGPAWDFDIALGLYASEAFGGIPNQDYMMNAGVLRTGGNAWFQELFRHPEFAKRAGEVYDSRVRPAVGESLAKLDTDISALKSSAEANFSRWPGVLDRSSIIVGARATPGTWAAGAAALREWVAERAKYLDSKYSARMPTLVYSAHSAQVGWQPGGTAGQFAGTTGRGLALEAVSVGLSGGATSGAIQSRAHVQNIGWTPWTTGDGTVGTTGRGLRLEAVSFALTARVAADYDLSYRVHVQNIGWMPWVSGGLAAGTTGQGLRVEAIQLRLLAKTAPVSGSQVGYSSHMSQLGWTVPVADGADSGAIGRGVQLEALRTSITSSEYDGTLSSRAHVQNIGWTAWEESPGMAGTEGLGLRMEALELRLNGELSAHYLLRYSVYVDGAWREWVTDGQTAGTTGEAKRIDAVRIELLRTG